eukprot:TRINITY_DN2939_c0_g1_i1.p1 TRINITY_DN2939_c0_g1~~TRINITY_DN2939_c0_g1_i1.p1  ORF type:complete len:120 (-),score=5.38 TRINITY_DN2939_c0_g1_i1:23-382(-)
MTTLVQLPSKLTQYARKITPVPRLVEITQIRSGEHSRKSVRDCLQKLGLKMNKIVIHKNISPIRGMIFRLRGYVSVKDYPIPERLLTQSEIEAIKQMPKAPQPKSVVPIPKTQLSTHKM